MSATNISLLAASLILQLLLLTLLLTRRMASHLFLFTVLLGFYAIRSVLLVLLFSRLSPGLYIQIYTVLSALDVLLQIALAIEFSLLILRLGNPPNLLRAFLIPAIFVSAAAFTAGVAALLPAHSPAPADRGSIFTGLLFIGVLLWSLRVGLPRWPRSALAGLAGLGAAAILTQPGRSVAAIHQNAHAYRLWSYTSVAVYLITLLFWVAEVSIAHAKAAPNSALNPSPARP